MCQAEVAIRKYTIYGGRQFRKEIGMTKETLDDIREVMTYYKQPQQFINQLHELNYLSDKVHKKIMKKLK